MPQVINRNEVVNRNAENGRGNGNSENALSGQNANKPQPRRKTAPNNIQSSNTNVLVAGNNQKLPASVTDADYFTPATIIFVAVVALAAASILAKKLFDRWKYGKNAAKNLRGLKRAVRVKDELTGKWLKKRKSANIHAIGVGKIEGTDEYCIQVFVEDANGEMLEDPPTRLLPERYRDLTVKVYEAPRARFLSFRVDLTEDVPAEIARQPHAVLRGGISGANANLTNDFGTIGYFFRPNFINNAARAFLKKHVYALSCSHVLADLTRGETDDSDLILHPSPGESAANRPIARLYDYAPLIFGGDVENPNFVDAAIAKLLGGQTHLAEIPRIGKITDYLRKEQVELRSACQKFGRTTGCTRGTIFSIHLSIWVKYPARGAEAFFKDQFLIVPTGGGSFARAGDSGSIAVDDENRAVGLIFAGAGAKTALRLADLAQAADLENIRLSQTPRVEHYGVANSISDVMREFKIKLDA